MKTKINEIKKEIKHEIEEIAKISEAKFSKEVQGRLNLIDLKIDDVSKLINEFSSEIEKYEKLSDKFKEMNESLIIIQESTINNPKFTKKFDKKR